MAALAIIPIRGGDLPPGAIEATVLAGGVALILGEGADLAALHMVDSLPGSQVWSIESTVVRSIDWERVLGGFHGFAGPILLPDSASGRDLSPRLAVRLGRTFLPHVIGMDERSSFTVLVRGLDSARCEISSPVVATVSPHPSGPLSLAEGAAALLARRTPDRGVHRSATEAIGGAARPPKDDGFDRSVIDDLVEAATLEARAIEGAAPSAHRSIELVEVLAADPKTMDLAESPKIIAGGDGVGTVSSFSDLDRVADAIGASVGGTRVVADRGLISHERQIGTTGVVVDPALYLAFGISGAVQHTAGLGSPDHIVSVNHDPHCPMMAMADLAIVADAPQTLAALAELVSTDLLGGSDTAEASRASAAAH